MFAPLTGAAWSPLLTDFWRDLTAIASAAITIVGFIVTVVSLVYAIRQIRQTKSAAEAAREAATSALAESRRGFQRYAAANAHRFVNEAKIHVENKSWAMAALRLSDLADQAAQLASIEAAWIQLAEELREWEATSRRVAAGELKRFAANKWFEFALRLQAKIDSYYGPFPAAGREVDGDSE